VLSTSKRRERRGRGEERTAEGRKGIKRGEKEGKDEREK